MIINLVILLVILSGLAFLYLKFIRPWQLTWGATDEEIKRTMPGDDIVSQPSFNATRAVTIQAEPGQIYPWIVQIGMNRAGWYSYDILDNLGRKSAQTLLPQHQHIQPGDLIPMSPDGKQGIYVKDFKQDRWILWWDQKNADTSWVWEIYPQGETDTRLVTRVRTKYHWLSAGLIFNLLIEFCDIIMMRKCMLGIKQRAEKKADLQPAATI
jgi:hypothetical protein